MSSKMSDFNRFRRSDFRSFNEEKRHSTDTWVTGKHERTKQASCMLAGYISLMVCWIVSFSALPRDAKSSRFSMMILIPSSTSLRREFFPSSSELVDLCNNKGIIIMILIE